MKKIQKTGLCGPGSYKISSIFSKNGERGKSIGIKGKVFNEVDKRNLNDLMYDVKYDLTQQKKYASVAGFTGSKRGAYIHELDERSPGPAYKLPSIFDRFKKKI